MLKTPSVMIRRRFAAGASAQRAAQVVGVGVLVDRLVGGAREPHAVDDRGVVEAIGEDRGALVAERVEQRGVRVPAGDVGERGAGAGEGGEVALELHVGSERAADEAHRGGPGAVARQPLGAGAHDVGMVGEAEVVVRAQAEDLAAALELDHRALRGAQHRDPLQRPGFGHLRQLGAQLGLERGHAASLANAASIDSATISNARSSASAGITSEGWRLSEVVLESAITPRRHISAATAC